MAKKGKGKGKGKEKKKQKQRRGFEGPGDLRAVRYHVEQWKKNGKEEALNMLMMLGRDASFTVCRIAEEWEDEELLEFGRRLVAVTPQLETNLLALREASVMRHLEREKAKAKAAVDATDLTVTGGQVAIFDPARVATDLAGGGRPRKDPARMEAGDVAWFGLPRPEEVPLRFTMAESVGPGLVLRLAVDSGLVFCGSPEASDGPRLGTVRRDPEHTRLDEHVDGGRFLRLKPGIYRVSAQMTAEGVGVALAPDADPSEPLGIDVQALSLPEG